ILDAYRFLAREEGVFCEPASAAGVAGLLAHGAEGAERIACVLTGHGLKDPQTALAHAGSVVPCEPDIEAVEHAIGYVRPPATPRTRSAAADHRHASSSTLEFPGG